MENIVVKISGKFFDNLDTSTLKEYRRVIERLLKEDYKIAVVVGGGLLARKYINAARELGVINNYWLDMIGIKASRLNAQLVIAILQPQAYPSIILSQEELVKAIHTHNIAVLGGLVPGQSTAAVALEAAEAIGAKKVFYMGAIDSVYTRDPRKHPDAKPLKEVTVDELRKLIEGENIPGYYQLLDTQSIEIMKRSRITIYLTHYSKPCNIIEFLKGGNPGTIIKPA